MGVYRLPAINLATKALNVAFTVTTGELINSCWVLLYNESPYLLDLDFPDGAGEQLNPFLADWFFVAGNSFQVTPSALLNLTNVPSTQLLMRVYDKNPPAQRSYPLDLSRASIVGGSVTASIALNGYYDVTAYGATGDGVTDDTTAIQAAATAAQNAGGGIVYFPAGTYIVHLTANPNDPTIMAAIHVASNVTLMGDGPGASTIKLVAAGALDQQQIICNWNPTPAGTDKNIRVQDLTLDGNAANQVVGVSLSACNGFRFYYVNGLSFEDVHSKNHIGTTSGGVGPSGLDGESIAIFAYRSSHVRITDCQAYGDDGGNTSSGISVSGGFDVRISDCVAEHLTFGQGFPTFRCYDLVISNCVAYDLGGDCFLLEQNQYNELVNCQAGLVTPPEQVATVPASTSYTINRGFVIGSSSHVKLANCLAFNATLQGFVVEIASSDPGVNSTNVLFVNCKAHSCKKGGYRIQDASVDVSCSNCEAISCGTAGDYGFYVLSTDTTGQFLFTNCRSNNNADYGWRFDTAGIFLRLINCEALGNVHSLRNAAGTTYNTLDGVLTSPAIPASTVALTNPFPFPMTVVVTGGTVSQIAVGGNNINITSGTVRVPVATTITLTYTVAPSWKWIAD